VEGSPDKLYHQPCIVDWDRDGRLDLVAFQLSGIAWYRNITAAGEPILVRPRVLLSLPHSDRLAGLTADDWDHDGWFDLVVGYIRSTYDEKGSFRSAVAGVRVYPRRLQLERSMRK
jgi:hypothetical protein